MPLDVGRPCDIQWNTQEQLHQGVAQLNDGTFVCLSDSIKHFASDFTSSQWKPRNEGNSIALTIIHHIVPFAVRKAIAVLHRDERDNSARSLVMLCLPFLGTTILTPLPGYRTRSGKAVA